MKTFVKVLSLALVAFMPALTSCGDDDKEDDLVTPPGTETPGGSDTETAVEPSVSNVFTNGLPQSVGDVSFTLNDKGQVTKMLNGYGYDEVTFEYGDITRAEEFDVLVQYTSNSNPRDNISMYLRLNNQGFVEYAYEVYANPEDEADEWYFIYNSDGQLSELRRSESGDVFKLNYADGDVTLVVQDEEDGDHREYTINYTNSQFPTVKANKGCLMEFDDFFNVDMDEMGIVYYAGLLGKATRNLPMGYTEKGMEGSSSYESSETFNWVFNANGFPTEFWEGTEAWDKLTFTWK